MDLFAHSELRRLSRTNGQWCVSIFVPTHRAGIEVQQGPIRLKNLLGVAERQLNSAGLRSSETATLLEPANALLRDSLFWQHQSDGLAVFASAGQLERYRVPLRLDEQVIVAKRFQLKPLLPLLTGDGHFFILALSQNEVRLMEATRYSIDELDVEQLPPDLRQSLGLGEAERRLQFHTGAAERGGQRAAMFHGHGQGQEQVKELLEKYFRKVDAAVCGFLEDDRAPLVLAGVDYYFPIYQSVSRYAQLMSDGVAGNPELLRPDELHSRAWPLVEPVFRQARETALARFRQLNGTGRTSTNVTEAVPAALQGRIEVLFVATDQQQWGLFDSDRQAVVLHEVSDAGNEDLLDFAAIATSLNGGKVYAIPSGEMPDGAVLAAVYRF